MYGRSDRYGSPSLASVDIEAISDDVSEQFGIIGFLIDAATGGRVSKAIQKGISKLKNKDGAGKEGKKKSGAKGKPKKGKPTMTRPTGKSGAGARDSDVDDDFDSLESGLDDSTSDDLDALDSSLNLSVDEELDDLANSFGYSPSPSRYCWRYLALVEDRLRIQEQEARAKGMNTAWYQDMLSAVQRIRLSHRALAESEASSPEKFRLIGRHAALMAESLTGPESLRPNLRLEADQLAVKLRQMGMDIDSTYGATTWKMVFEEPEMMWMNDYPTSSRMERIAEQVALGRDPEGPSPFDDMADEAVEEGVREFFGSMPWDRRR